MTTLRAKSTSSSSGASRSTHVAIARLCFLLVLLFCLHLHAFSFSAQPSLHLRHNRVRFVGDPVQRIREDYLRILRYFRFHGRVCSEDRHEPDQLAAVRTECPGLSTISGERIWAEMRQLLRFRRGPALIEVRRRQGAEKCWRRMRCCPKCKCSRVQQLEPRSTSLSHPLHLLPPGDDELWGVEAHWLGARHIVPHHGARPRCWVGPVASRSPCLYSLRRSHVQPLCYTQDLRPCTAHSYTEHPATRLVALLNSEDDVEQLFALWRFSLVDRKLMSEVINARWGEDG